MKYVIIGYVTEVDTDYTSWSASNYRKYGYNHLKKKINEKTYILIVNHQKYLKRKE